MFLYINILKKTKNDFHFAYAILLHGLVYICFVKKLAIHTSMNHETDNWMYTFKPSL